MAACIAVVLAAGIGFYKSGFFRAGTEDIILPGQTDTTAVRNGSEKNSGPLREDSTTEKDGAEKESIPEKETASGKGTYPVKNGVPASDDIHEEKSTAEENYEPTERAAEQQDERSEEPPQEDGQQKGGDTSELLQQYSVSPEDGAYYKIFRPGIDPFEPLDEMTLENRFCSVRFNGKSYYPAPDGDIRPEDYEPESIGYTRAINREIRSADEYAAGIEYRARVDIYKLKDADPEEAIACVISFNGETKAYKYLLSP